MLLDVIETACELVRIPSVNPMGRTAVGPPYLEAALTEHLEEVFRRLGLKTQRQPVAPGRDNLLARLDGEVPAEDGGPLVLLDAHQDTVPTERMKIEPWVPSIREGRLYGRGACDTKGGMAAMLAALARLAEEQPRGMPTIIMACTADEEYRLSGAAALESRLQAANPAKAGTPTDFIPRLPDSAIIAEPTGLDMVVAHKGVIRWRCHTCGRAAHSSAPDAGENAIYKMGRVLAAIEQFAAEVPGEIASHPLCGGCTLNVGTISGGSSINIVPDHCTIEIEIRVPPGLQAGAATPEIVRSRLIDYLAVEAGLGPLIHDPPYMQAPPLSDETNAAVSDRLASAVVAVKGECRRLGAPYATDAAFYSAAGIPAVAFGPGSIQQAHTDDEWVALEQLTQAAEILYRFLTSWSTT